MDQSNWNRLSDLRITEAQALIAAGFWAGSYYLAGYAVECKLKALVVKMVDDNPGIILVDRNFQKDVWTHNIEALLKKIGLSAKRVDDVKKTYDSETFGHSFSIGKRELDTDFRVNLKLEI